MGERKRIDFHCQKNYWCLFGVGFDFDYVDGNKNFVITFLCFAVDINTKLEGN